MALLLRLRLASRALQKFMKFQKEPWAGAATASMTPARPWLVIVVQLPRAMLRVRVPPR